MLFRRASRFVALTHNLMDAARISTSCCRATGGSRARPRATAASDVALLQEDVDALPTRSPRRWASTACCCPTAPRLATVYDARRYAAVDVICRARPRSRR